MKAIILAAGEGTRLKKYTRHLPKGMLDFAGKSLIERQIHLFRQAGIDDIIIIKGFAQDKIHFPDVTYYINHQFDTTNMVVSLFCAEKELQDDVIVSYADILFDVGLLKAVMDSKHDITVCVDMEWKTYWKMRYGTIHIDTESLKIDHEQIVFLGKENPPLKDIDGRYIGLLRFAAAGIEQFKSVWYAHKENFWDKPWQVSGKPLSKAYMTDILQALIDAGHNVHALKWKNGWIEFDTNEDYEKALLWNRNGKLHDLLSIDD